MDIYNFRAVGPYKMKNTVYYIIIYNGDFITNDKTQGCVTLYGKHCIYYYL